MNSININGLRFPIIFDPYNGYINDERNEKCLKALEENNKLTDKPNHNNSQDSDLFISMVCHHIRQFKETDATSKDEDDIPENNKDAANNNTYTHHLG